jgi:hypothetical protein
MWSRVDAKSSRGQLVYAKATQATSSRFPWAFRVILWLQGPSIWRLKQAFWQVTPSRCAGIPWRFEWSQYRHLHAFQTSGNTCVTTQRHIPHLQQHCCERLEPCSVLVFLWNDFLFREVLTAEVRSLVCMYSALQLHMLNY